MSERSEEQCKAYLVCLIIWGKQRTRPNSSLCLSQMVQTRSRFCGRHEYRDMQPTSWLFMSIPHLGYLCLYLLALSDNGKVAQEYDSQRGSHQAEAGAEEFQPSKHFLTSPSINFTSRLIAATPVNWRGRKAQVVLQTRQVTLCSIMSMESSATVRVRSRIVLVKLFYRTKLTHAV
jgi:hypothetical protein